MNRTRRQRAEIHQPPRSETSPYLRQHAHNPVDWYPWGAEAFERARAEHKPILLSAWAIPPATGAMSWRTRAFEDEADRAAV